MGKLDSIQKSKVLLSDYTQIMRYCATASFQVYSCIAKKSAQSFEAR